MENIQRETAARILRSFVDPACDRMLNLDFEDIRAVADALATIGGTEKLRGLELGPTYALTQADIDSLIALGEMAGLLKARRDD